jgi:thioredoxin reductase (NADPH)
MKLPYILAVDDDEQVLSAITRDLRSEYSENYRIVSTSSATEALEALAELKKKKKSVALLVADQRMPEMPGVEFLRKALGIFPEARRVLLTAYSDTDAAIEAINELQLDYYFIKPWDPPEEKLYPVLQGLLTDWQATHHPDFEGIKVVGYQFSPRSHEIKDFLASNLVPYQWLEVHSNTGAKELMEEYGCKEDDLPLIVLEDGRHLCKPDMQSLAPEIGLQLEAKESLYDVVIIGAGPAGLAAAVYGGSEGLRTLLIEKHSPGGQAGSSARIENYLGFPRGLSGAELSQRALLQVSRFGVELLAPQEVKDIKLQGNYKILTLSDGTEIKSRSIILSTGVKYKMLPAREVQGFTGAGIYYGGAMTEAPTCNKKKIFIVGGGNSAGQAAVYLSHYASKVVMLIRNESLESSMSKYLIDQIAAEDNIDVWPYTEIQEAIGEDKLESLRLLNTSEDREWVEEEVEVLFIYIGAEPHTEWLPIHIITNKEGYIETGRDLLQYPDYSKFWKARREPYLLETCTPGIFAAGDVRAGALNRVASAVGEGSMSIKFVHQYLAEN